MNMQLPMPLTWEQLVRLLVHMEDGDEVVEVYRSTPPEWAILTVAVLIRKPNGCRYHYRYHPDEGWSQPCHV